MARWTAGDIPDQSGRVAVVTGANSGIGFETARALAAKGADVILACRDAARGEAAAANIRSGGVPGNVSFLPLDLSRLESVRVFADRLGERSGNVDLLINNAGVMVPPFSRTAEGLELQIGVNFFGHFALTGLLFDRIRAAPKSRIVTISSLAHRTGRIDFESFRGEKGYSAWREYAQSKLADLMFALELQRRLERAGLGTISTAAHPGSTKTELQRHGRLLSLFVDLWSNDAAQGALPTLFAATAPQAEPGGYYGPDGFYEMRGYPSPSKVMPAARDEATARRLWQIAESETGVSFLPERP